MDLDTAYAKCTALANSHYENFPVGRIVPKAIRHHVHAVYAFARVSDDIADEGYVKETSSSSEPLTQQQRLELLDHYEQQLTAALEQRPLDPQWEWIFLAVRDTAKQKNIPTQLFHDLLSAFKQDVTKRRYETFAEVKDYCRRSANPVGRLVLHLHDYHDEERHRLSDHICTALQLANFWQDISVDLLKDRIYIPLEDMAAFGFSVNELIEKKPKQEIFKCVEFQVNRTWELFKQGAPLSRKLHRPLNWEIRWTWLGGTTILQKIERQQYNTLYQRPKLSKWDMLRILPLAWLKS